MRDDGEVSIAVVHPCGVLTIGDADPRGGGGGAGQKPSVVTVVEDIAGQGQPVDPSVQGVGEVDGGGGVEVADPLHIVLGAGIPLLATVGVGHAGLRLQDFEGLVADVYDLVVFGVGHLHQARCRR